MATAKERGWLPQAASPAIGAYCRARDHLSPSSLAALVERSHDELAHRTGLYPSDISKMAMGCVLPTMPQLRP